MFQPLLESGDEQLPLAEEVPVKPAVGQMEISHQIVDPSSFAATAAEPASRRLHDFLSGLLLVFRPVAPRRPLYADINHLIVSQGLATIFKSRFRKPASDGELEDQFQLDRLVQRT